jgi:hypothetical protein
VRISTPPPARLAFSRAAVLVALAGLAACQGDRGEVEIDWTLVDRAGTQVFPSGSLDDTCSFYGLVPGAGDERVDYSVHVEVRLCEPDCEAGCSDPACLHTRLDFDCTAARGYATVEARPDEPYEFDVRLVAAPADGSCACDLTAPCALVPGPRRRTVEPGLITDLQVYLMVLGVDAVGAAKDGAGRVVLDLAPADEAACCVPDPSCAP